MQTQQLLDGIFCGNEQAQRQFVAQYRERLAAYAKRFLKGLPAPSSGTEVAQVVMGDFLMRARNGRGQTGRIVNIGNRDDLERFLFCCVRNRAFNERKRAKSDLPMKVVDDSHLIASDAFAKKFGPQGVRLAHLAVIQRESFVLQDDQIELLQEIRNWIEKHRVQPGPVFSINDQVDCVHETQVADNLMNSKHDPALGLIIEEAFEILDPQTRVIVSMRLLGGYKLNEIAQHVGVCIPTVRHRIEDAYELWERAFNE